MAEEDEGEGQGRVTGRLEGTRGTHRAQGNRVELVEVVAAELLVEVRVPADVRQQKLVDRARRDRLERLVRTI